MMIKPYLRQNKTAVAVLLFLAIFTAVHYIKPIMFYTEDGGFRQFGVGYRKKTVMPIWIFAILLAILCYLVVSYIIMFG